MRPAEDVPADVLVEACRGKGKNPPRRKVHAPVAPPLAMKIISCFTI